VANGDWMDRMERQLRERHYLTTMGMLREGFRRVEIGWLSTIGGLAFHFLRTAWEMEDLEAFSPPGLPGLEWVRCTPVRSFAELAAARRLGAAEDVGKALVLPQRWPDAGWEPVSASG